MKLQKHIAVLFCALYFLVSIGPNQLVLHFCGDQLAGVATSISTESCGDESEADTCCPEINNVPDSCCSDETVEINNSDDQINFLESNNFTSVALEAIKTLLSFDCSYTSIAKQPLFTYAFQSNAPPIYKLLHSYIYYDA